METAIRASLVLGIGILLLGANLWFVRIIAGLRSESYVISPIKVVGAPSSMDGMALAMLLQARIQSIENQLETANRALIPETATPEPKRGAAPPIRAITPIQPLRLPTEILSAPDVNVKVSGVEVSGWVRWLQSRIAEERTLSYAVYLEGADTATTAMADLRDFSRGNGAIVWLKPPKKEGIPELIDDLAYATLQARLGLQQGDRVSALAHDEFKALVTGIVALSELATRAGKGMVVGSGDYKPIMDNLKQLAAKAGRWPELDYMMAMVAERAEEYDEAARLYRLVHDSSALAGPELRRAIADDEIVGHIVRCDALKEKKPPSYTAEETAAAKAKLDQELGKIWAAYNELFRTDLPRAPLNIIQEPNAYWDPANGSINVMAMTDQIPDVLSHEAAYPFLFRHISLERFNKDQESGSTEAFAVVLSYSGAVASWHKQKLAGQSAQQADWVLGSGFLWLAYGGKRKEPIRSLRSPKIADYAVYRDANFLLEPHDASGIGAKAFYELSMRVGTDAALRLWLEALPALANSLTFRSLAAATTGVAEKRKDEAILKAVQRSWAIVNVHP